MNYYTNYNSTNYSMNYYSMNINSMNSTINCNSKWSSLQLFDWIHQHWCVKLEWNLIIAL